MKAKAVVALGKPRGSAKPMQAEDSKVADALREIDRRMAAIGRLKEDWDSYGAGPPSQLALSKIRSLIADVTGRHLATAGIRSIPFTVAPVPDGGVQAEWRNGPRLIEVEVSPEGSFGYLLLTKQNSGSDAEEHDHVPESKLLELIPSVVD
jgi:hypothetical protein